MKNFALAIMFFLGTIVTSFGQVTIQFGGTSNGSYYGLDNLCRFTTITLNAQSQRVVLKGSIKDGTGIDLVSFESSQILLAEGVRLWTKNEMNFRKLIFSGTRNGFSLENGQTLAPGAYVACLEVYSIERAKVLATSCQEVAVMAISPPQLIYPGHTDKINVLRPGFSWTLSSIGLTTAQQEVDYEVALVELRGENSGGASMDNNIPLFRVKSEGLLFIGFPSQSESLQWGQKYAWRVRATFRGKVIGQSGVHVFEPEKPIASMTDGEPITYEVNSTQQSGILRVRGLVNVQLSDYIPDEVLEVSLHAIDGKDHSPKNGLSGTGNLIQIDPIAYALKKDEVYYLRILRHNGLEVKVLFKYI